MIVRSIRNKMFDDLWIKLGGEELRRIVIPLLSYGKYHRYSADSINNIYWTFRRKIQQDILKERSKDYEKR